MRDKLAGKYEEIISLYTSGINAPEISRTYGVVVNSIYNLLKNNKIPIRSIHESKMVFTVDDDFFESISTQEKAYILGFIYADGHVCKDRPYFKIQLAEEDGYILERMKEIMRYSGNIYDHDKKKPHHQNYKSLHVTSRKMRNDLLSHGLEHDKSFKIRLPTLQDDMYRHFIRGFFDGDGCATFSKTGCRQVNIISNEMFIDDCIQLINNELSVVCGKSKHFKCYYLRLTRKSFIKKFYDWLYEGATIFLVRKKAKIESMF